LLEGRLAIKDLADAWRARFKADLGIEPPDDRDGVLQDVHWYAGVIGGAFHGYTLGNVLSAQYFDAATKAHREIVEQIRRGEFGVLHAWLKEHLYRHGSKYTAAELTERVTGAPMSVEPYLRYMAGKFGPLYDLDAGVLNGVAPFARAAAG